MIRSLLLLFVVIISVISGFHFVSVHVLSKTIVFILQAASSGSHHFISIPYFAHCHVHTISAVGVANQSAQGHAITITAAKYNNDVSIFLFNIKYQVTKVIVANKMIIGTKYFEILSANDWMGALDH